MKQYRIANKQCTKSRSCKQLVYTNQFVHSKLYASSINHFLEIARNHKWFITYGLQNITPQCMNNSNVLQRTFSRSKGERRLSRTILYTNSFHKETLQQYNKVVYQLNGRIYFFTCEKRSARQVNKFSSASSRFLFLL